MVEIYPSLISSDLLNLRCAIELLDPVVSGYHIDIMDFHFVPNLTWGPDFIAAISQATKKPLMIHLMVNYPENYFDRLRLTAKDYLCVHPESYSDLSFSQLLASIKERDWIPSIALNPETSLSHLQTHNELAQHVLLMAVQAGFSGQKLLPAVYEKIDDIKALHVEKPITIAVDGGVTFENASKLVARGAHQLVAGSAIFKESDPVLATIRLSQS